MSLIDTIQNGFEVTVQRACIMIALVLIWRLKFRYLSIIDTLFIALAVVLAMNPLVVLQAGFWLSFFSVAILVVGFNGRLAQLRKWQTAVKAQWLISIGLIPLLLMLCLPISMTGPLANLIAIPWVSMVVLPFALLGTLCLPIPYVGQFFLTVAAYSFKLLFYVLSALSSWASAWIAPVLPWWGYVSLAIGCVLLLLPRGVPLRFFGLVLCFPLFCVAPKVIRENHALITVFDVGQGTAILIQTAQHSLLYDTGPAFGDFNVADRIVIPAIKRMGINTLDAVIVSHADIDHAGGVTAILDELVVKQVIGGEPNLLLDKNKQPCHSGTRWFWDGVTFSLWQWPRAMNGNEASCVLLIEANGERLLLTGDISKRAEHDWAETQKIKPIHWLVASHHGSRFASSEHFLNQITPSHVIFSRGWLNSFGHPHQQTLLRYRQRGVIIWDTARDGALQINLGTYSSAKKQRDKMHFWQKK